MQSTRSHPIVWATVFRPNAHEPATIYTNTKCSRARVLPHAYIVNAHADTPIIDWTIQSGCR